jgi:hypothetical protein
VTAPAKAAGGWLRGLLDQIFGDEKPQGAPAAREQPWTQRGGPP